MKIHLPKIILILLIGLGCPMVTKAYSVLTHEALIDACWDHYLAPLLKERYPLLDSSLLKEAHAYAYGGAVAPDMGYYPFGSKLFTDLVHYVRSGDFVTALLDESRNADEYAFALGALCHYHADIYGHRLGVNVTVPVEYPKDREKFGNAVTYEEDKTAHKRVEFSFDVLETAKGNYASQAYHDFIGFRVADSVLERAFYKTYRLHLTDIFPSFSRAVGTFRWTIKNIFPLLTKAAWASKRSVIKEQQPTITARQFHYKMKRANYNKEFGRERNKPGLFSFLFAALIRVLPKIGPLKPLKFKAPGTEAEKLLVQSFDSVRLHYSGSLKKMLSQKVTLANKDYDTGMDTKPGEYQLTDDTYCDWLFTLRDKNFEWVGTTLKQNIIQFFDNGVVLAEKRPVKKKKINKALLELEDISTFE